MKFLWPGLSLKADSKVSVPFLSPLSLSTRVWSPLSGQEFLACQLDSRCAVEKLSQEMNILTGTWLSIYNTDNTYFSKSHFYSSIHVIVAEKEKKRNSPITTFPYSKQILQCWEKKKKETKRKSNPSAKITNFFAFSQLHFLSAGSRAGE